ncbi:hypothetical protein [Desulfurobacterium crinifex]
MIKQSLSEERILTGKEKILNWNYITAVSVTSLFLLAIYLSTRNDYLLVLLIFNFWKEIFKWKEKLFISKCKLDTLIDSSNFKVVPSKPIELLNFSFKVAIDNFVVAGIDFFKKQNRKRIVGYFLFPVVVISILFVPIFLLIILVGNSFILVLTYFKNYVILYSEEVNKEYTRELKKPREFLWYWIPGMLIIPSKDFGKLKKETKESLALNRKSARY